MVGQWDETNVTKKRIISKGTAGVKFYTRHHYPISELLGSYFPSHSLVLCRISLWWLSQLHVRRDREEQVNVKLRINRAEWHGTLRSVCGVLRTHWVWGKILRAKRTFSVRIRKNNNTKIGLFFPSVNWE